MVGLLVVLVGCVFFGQGRTGIYLFVGLFL